MKVPINIFYHVMLCNHYKEIVLEQLADIYESGIYDECTTIYVGCLGSEEDFIELKKIFADQEFTKVEFYHHEDIKQYEFFTLKALKCVADVSPLFYGMYIHSKAVNYPKSNPAYLGGRFWRHHMNHWIIKKWKENYHALDLKYLGYDLAGVKVVPARVSPSNRTHISGNFFWFNSEYIRSLAKIETLNLDDRFEAENWCTSGQPIIYMPCNLFIDYLSTHDDYDTFTKTYTEYKNHCL